MAEAQQIAGDHLLTQLQPFGDGITIVLKRTEAHWGLQCEQACGGNHAAFNALLDAIQIGFTRLSLQLPEGAEPKHKALA